MRSEPLDSVQLNHAVNDRSAVIPGTGRPEHIQDNVRAGFGVMPDRELRQRMVAALT